MFKVTQHLWKNQLQGWASWPQARSCLLPPFLLYCCDTLPALGPGRGAALKEAHVLEFVCLFFFCLCPSGVLASGFS